MKVSHPLSVHNEIPSLISGRAVARNTVWNIFGQSVPLLVAFIAIPRLIHSLGIARFGVLPLAWTIIGYFSLFDFGLGRALTKLVAEKLVRREDPELPALIWTGLSIMLLLGLIGGVAAALLSPWLVHRVLKIPAELQTETIQSFYVIACTIPVVVSATGLRGILEAQQRFDLVNAVRAPLGIFTYLGPLLIIPFSQNLAVIMLTIAASRTVAWAAQLWFCLEIMPVLRKSLALQKSVIKALLTFGTWMTVSNIISPLMSYLDRFVIGAYISLSAVAYYAAPYEVATKILLVPGALVAVLFPSFSASLVQDPLRAAHLFDRGATYIFLMLFPVSFLVVSFAHLALKIWLGDDFAQNSTPVLQWLVIGCFINALASVPFALVQGGGRPDLTAKLHLAELPFYFVALWWLIRTFGITGAAIAWAGRVAVDALILFFIAGRMLPNSAERIRKIAFNSLLSLFIFGLASLEFTLSIKFALSLIVFPAFGVLSWLFVLTDEERLLIHKLLRSESRQRLI